MRALCSLIFKKQQALLWQQRHAQIKLQSSWISWKRNAVTLLVCSVFTLCMLNAMESLDSVCLIVLRSRRLFRVPWEGVTVPTTTTTTYHLCQWMDKAWIILTENIFSFLEAVKIAQLICESSECAWLTVFSWLVWCNGAIAETLHSWHCSACGQRMAS